jgi:ABC-type nitrate/sulfonate/bicarbonate transport system ATPase subunit
MDEPFGSWMNRPLEMQALLVDYGIACSPRFSVTHSIMEAVYLGQRVDIYPCRARLPMISGIASRRLGALLAAQNDPIFKMLKL